MKEIESIPNAARIFEAIRSLGYDLNSSIADVIDNSITDKVGAKHVKVDFKFNLKGKIVCRILDDGSGMNEKQLIEAMRLGSDSSYNESDLGKFGMGMKSASLSHCNVLTVISKGKKSEICGMRWDMGQIKKRGWSLLQLSKSEIQEITKREKVNLGNNGTLILWDNLFLLDEQIEAYTSEKLRNNYIHRLLQDLKLHLGMVYHRYLDGTLGKANIIDIRVNDESVSPWDPFCTSEKHTKNITLKQGLETFKIPGYRSPVKIKAYVIPKQQNFSSEKAWKLAKGLLSWNDSQGYYIYRSNRIIRFGGWHGTKAKDEHDKLARLSIDIDSSLDQLFRITVNKAKVQFPESLYQHLKNDINPVVVKKAKLEYNNKNEPHKVVNKFRRSGADIVDLSKELIEENKIKTRTSANSSSKAVEVSNPSGVWLSNKINDFLKYGNEKDYEIISDNIPEDHLWKIVCAEKSRFKVIVNSGHPFYERIYGKSTNKAVTSAIDALIFSLAFAELYNKNNHNSNLFDTFKSVCSQALERLVKEKIF